jgi:hypothetical protein
MPDFPSNQVMVAISPFLWPLGEEKGVRTVYETLAGYVRRVYQVHLVTAASGDEQPELHRVFTCYLLVPAVWHKLWIEGEADRLLVTGSRVSSTVSSKGTCAHC